MHAAVLTFQYESFSALTTHFIPRGTASLPSRPIAQIAIARTLESWSWAVSSKAYKASTASGTLIVPKINQKKSA